MRDAPDEQVQHCEPGKASGRRARAVPALREKIDHLLERSGRQNQWLTEVLVAPDGRQPTTGGVGNWKNTGRIPIDYLVSFRTVFAIDDATLMEPDFDAFKASVDAVMMPGGGRFWKTLLEKAETGPDALLLRIDGAPEPAARRLRNLVFHRPGPMAAPLIPIASFDDGVRFSVPTARLAPLVATAGGIDAINLVLCCEDKLGWKTMTPTRHHPGFEEDGERYSFPGPACGPLYFHETVGNYRAVLVAVAARLPKAIDQALRADKTVWGTDALAAWLFGEKPKHLVMDRPFLVTSPRS